MTDMDQLLAEYEAARAEHGGGRDDERVKRYLAAFVALRAAAPTEPRSVLRQLRWVLDDERESFMGWSEEEMSPILERAADALETQLGRLPEHRLVDTDEISREVERIRVLLDLASEKFNALFPEIGSSADGVWISFEEYLTGHLTAIERAIGEQS